jgi:hypothetical protein
VEELLVQSRPNPVLVHLVKRRCTVERLAPNSVGGNCGTPVRRVDESQLRVDGLVRVTAPGAADIAADGAAVADSGEAFPER